MNLLKHCVILKKYNLLQGNIKKMKDTDDINIERYNLPEFSPSSFIALTVLDNMWLSLLRREQIALGAFLL